MPQALPGEAKVVVVGGGIIGTSIAYHLTKLGWKDVILLEQNQLAGGTTWHAAGLIGRLRTTNSMTKINKYSAELYASLEKETGHPVGWKQVGSLIVGRSAERMQQLHRTAAMAEWFGVEVQIINPKAALEKWPLLRIDDVQGAAWLPHDGKLIPKEVTLALAKGAQQRGARIIENARVLEVTREHGRATGVRVQSFNPAAADVRRLSSEVEDEVSLLTSAATHEIKADYVVLAGGMWTRELGLRCGVTIPLYPVEHHYVVTESIPGAFDELPVGRDPDLCIYFRGEGDAVMLGAFQAHSKAWMVEHVPDKFSFQLLDPDWAKFAEPLKNGKHRIPALETAKFAKFVNGPESFTPDNNFILGEAPELKHLFVAAGFNSVGIASAGGAGKYLAEWMIDGQPTIDLWSVDIRRFAPWANNLTFLRERVTEVLGLHYQMAWPNRELETGRGLRKTPLHEQLAARGACFGVKNGWERPNWFARSVSPAEPPPSPLNGERAGVRGESGQSGAVEGSAPPHPGPLPPVGRGGEGEDAGATIPSPSPLGGAAGEASAKKESSSAGVRGESEFPISFASVPKMDYSFGRQNWFANHAFEHRACRENVAVFDQSAFTKLTVKGHDAVKVLQRLCGNNVDVPPGKTIYTGLFNERGGFESDLTLVRTSEDEFYLVTGTAQTVRDSDWITRHILPNEHAELVDVTNSFGVLGLMGPNARALLSRVTDADLSNDAFPFGTAQFINVGRATAHAVRLTYVGELGWELHVPMEQLEMVYTTLVAAGIGFDLANAGHYAINSLRLEKGYRAWGAELSPDDTPLEAGLGFAIDWNKPFLGRDALLKQQAAGLKRRLVIFVLQDPGPVLWGSELIYRDGKPAGYTTSGSYGHTVGGAIAMGYVNCADGVTADYVKAGRYEINVNGQRFPAAAHLRAPYDPERKRVLV